MMLNGNVLFCYINIEQSENERMHDILWSTEYIYIKLNDECTSYLATHIIIHKLFMMKCDIFISKISIFH